MVGNIEEYFSNSQIFSPERWLKKKESCPFGTEKIHPFVSLPFGYGRRACLGRRFAEAELHILLAKVSLVNTFEISLFKYFYCRYSESTKLNIIMVQWYIKSYQRIRL